MNHDRTTLDPRVEVTTHGCGEYFPLDETGEQLDPDPKNPERDQMDRRVEVFFFDRELGVQPPATEKVSQRGSVEYLEWRARAKQTPLFQAAGRAGIIKDHARNLDICDAFLEQILVPLVKITTKHPTAVHSFDFYNEPYWNDRSQLHSCRSRRKRDINRFLDRCMAATSQALGSSGLLTTIGHAGQPDMQSYRTGSYPQFHFYPMSHATNRHLPSYVGKPAPILGEIGTNKAEGVFPVQTVAAKRPWPELNGADTKSQRECVRRRLWRANDKGYDLCLLWPDVEKDREVHCTGRQKFGSEVWQAIDDYHADRRK